MTDAKKVTYIGYSQGAAQMFVGLSQFEESFFAERLNKAVLLAACLYPAPVGINFYREVFPVYKARGMNTYWGEDFNNGVASICEETPESQACTSAYIDPTTQVNSRKSQEYFVQMAAVGRFQ